MVLTPPKGHEDRIESNGMVMLFVLELAGV